MVRISRISSMPSWPMSSSRPMNGEMKVAPALAASSAWLAEKHSVTLTIVPSPVSALQALRPSQVSGTLTVTFLAILASARPSLSMPSRSVAATSALTGPGTSCADLGDDLLEVAPGLGHQRRIGGDAVEQAGCGQLLDLGHVRRIDEEFHAGLSNLAQRPSLRAVYAAEGNVGVSSALRQRPLFAFSSSLGYSHRFGCSLLVLGYPFGKSARQAR